MYSIIGIRFFIFVMKILSVIPYHIMRDITTNDIALQSQNSILFI